MGADAALIVEVDAAEPVVGRWRLGHDPVAARGVPAHVTVLYPFRERDAIVDDDLDRVAEIASGVAPFEFALTRLDEFPGVLWLRPEPDEAFRAITAALWAAFPDCPPYEGRHPDVQPHLTVAFLGTDLDAAGSQTLRSALAADVGPALPINATATDLSLFVADDETNWRRVRRFPFATIA